MINQSDDPNGINKVRGPSTRSSSIFERIGAPRLESVFSRLETNVNRETARANTIYNQVVAANAEYLERERAAKVQGLAGIDLQRELREPAAAYHTWAGRYQEEMASHREAETIRASQALGRLTGAEYKGTARAAELRDPIRRGSAYVMSRTTPYAELQEQYGATLSNITQAETTYKEAIKDPTQKEKIRGLASTLTGLYSQEALQERAIQYKPDPAAIHAGGERFVNRVLQESTIGRRVEEFKSGGVSADTLRSDLDAAKNSLLSTFRELEKAMKSGAKNVDALSEKFEEAQDNFETASKTLREAGVSPTGGGVGDAILTFLSGGTAALIQAGISAIKVAASTAQFAAVSLPRQQAAIGTQFGEMAANAYTDWRSVAAGDVGAFYRLQSYNTIANIGERVTDVTQLTEGGRITAQGLQLGMDVTKGYAAGGGTTATQSLIEGGGNILQEAWALPTTAAGQAVQTTQQAWQAQAVLNRIPAEMGQSLFNVGTGMAYSMRGAGGQRNAAYEQVMSSAGMNRLAGVGIDIEKDAPRLFAQATAEFGGQFRAQSVMNTVVAAGAATRGGQVASEAQYMAMAGQISTAGGDTALMEKVLREAVAAGMDNSKNLQQMVSGISSLAMSTGGAQGVNMTNTMERYMLAGAQAGKDIGMPENLRAIAAQSAIQRVATISGSSGMDLGTLQQMQMLRQAAPNMSRALLSTVMNTEVYKFRDLQALTEAGKDKEAVKQAEMMGLYGLVNESGTGLNKQLLNVSARGAVQKTLMNMGIQIGDPEKVKVIEDTILNAKPGQTAPNIIKGFTAGQKEVWGAVAAQAKLSPIELMQSLLVSPLNKASAGAINKGGVDTAEKFTVTASQAAVKVVHAAMEEMKKTTPTAAFKELAGSMGTLVATMKPQEFAKNVREAFKEMKLPALDMAGKDIQTGAAVFKEAAIMLAAKLGVSDADLGRARAAASAAAQENKNVSKKGTLAGEKNTFILK